MTTTTGVDKARLFAIRKKLVEAETRLYEATKIMNFMFDQFDVQKEETKTWACSLPEETRNEYIVQPECQE